MTDWLINPHHPDDLPEIVALVNSAYRGDSSKAGWAYESDYIDGQRTSLHHLREDLSAEPPPTLLVLRQEAGGEILACAMIERAPKADGMAGYIGMVTVKPTLQTGGVGRTILAAAEDAARAFGATHAEMTVISRRDTLIEWYVRRGYAVTGERRPFPYGDDRFGIPLVDDLEFVVLEKPLGEG
jgi:ribosomal protein S18 acetylase RimI-like enzyme